MKKKYSSVAIAFIIVMIASTLSVSAMSVTDDINVYIKGSYFMPNPDEGYEVVIKDDRTFLPLRYVAETLNYEVNWDQSTQGISMTSGSTTVNMTVGNSSYTVNGVRKTMDTEPFLQSDRTYVPLRFAAEAFGEKVQWDNNNRTAIIGSYSDRDINSAPGTSVELKNAGLFINVADPDSIVIEDVQTGTAIYDKESYDAYKADGSEGGWIVTLFRSDKPSVDIYTPGILLDYADGVYIQAQLPSDVQAYLVEGDEQPYIEKYNANSDMVKESLKHILLSEEEGRGDVIEADLRSYESLIASLPSGYYYAFADIDDKNDALLAASSDHIFRDLNGDIKATEAWVYGYGNNGNIIEYGYAASGGTANPLSVKNGALYYANHRQLWKAYIDETSEKLIIEETDDFSDYEGAIEVIFSPTGR